MLCLMVCRRPVISEAILLVFAKTLLLPVLVTIYLIGSSLATVSESMQWLSAHFIAIISEYYVVMIFLLS